MTSRPSPPAPLTPAEREDYAERAAIIEYLGGVPRGEAERRAMDLIIAERRREERAERLGFAASDAVVVG